MSFQRRTLQQETHTISVSTSATLNSSAQMLPTTSLLACNFSIALSQALLSGITCSPSNADVAANLVIGLLGYRQALCLAASGQVRWARRRLKDVWSLLCVRVHACALVRILLRKHTRTQRSICWQMRSCARALWRCADARALAASAGICSRTAWQSMPAARRRACSSTAPLPPCSRSSRSVLRGHSRATRTAARSSLSQSHSSSRHGTT